MTPSLKRDIKIRNTFSHLKSNSASQHAAARIVLMHIHNITMFPLQTAMRYLAGACNTKSKNCSYIYHAVFIETTCFQGKSLQSTVLALSLFVLRVLTDNSDCALSLDDLTFFANRFYGRPNLHCISLLSKKVRLSLYHLFFYFASLILRDFSSFSIFSGRNGVRRGMRGS